MSADKITKEDETVYEDGSKHMYAVEADLEQDVENVLNVQSHSRWLVRFTVCREAESTDIRVTAVFGNRYSFPEKTTLEVAVKAEEKEITEKFDLDNKEDNCFTIPLTKNGFPEADDKDIEVSCRLLVTDVKYYTDRIGTNANFLTSDRPHDVVLVVGETKFYVHKVYLATWSKFFDKLFFTYEKGKKEVEIKDVDPAEFSILLRIIHPDKCLSIDEDNVQFLLKLADRFEIPSVMVDCGTFLKDFDKCTDLDVMKRLELSDTHNLAHLQVVCLDRIHKKRPSDHPTFKDVNRKRIKKLGVNTKDNLV